MFNWRKSLGIIPFISALLTLHQQPITAQIVPDFSLGIESAIVISPAEFLKLIQGGAIRGENLFQSYQDFNISEGQIIILTNPNDVNNILIRVTGDNPSNLFGNLSLIKESTVNNLLPQLPLILSSPNVDISSLITSQDIGTANLFFLNPNGIIFGKNATLNVGGSFIATTANQINFSDGTVFSANIAQSSSLLTISTPIGLQFTEPNPNPITIQGRERILNNFLENSDNLTDAVRKILNELLVDRIFNEQFQQVGLNIPSNKTLALVGGNVNLDGGVLTAQGGRIEIGSIINTGTVSLTPVANGWQLGYEGVEKTNQGNITLNQLALINPDILGAGNGEVNLQGQQVNLNNESAIISWTMNNNDGGNINIKTTDITLENESIITTGTISPLSLLTPEEIVLFNLNPLLFRQIFAEDKRIPFILSTVAQNSGNFIPSGNSGNLLLNSQNFTLNDFSILGSLTAISNGQSGEVIIQATDTVNLLKDSLLSQIYFGQGSGGNMVIDTQNLNILSSAEITSEPDAGKGGNVNINASESVIIDGQGSDISANVNGQGDGGNINVNTQQLTVSDGGAVLTNLADNSAGNSGNINLVSQDLTITDRGLIQGELGMNSTGNGGEINIVTQRLNLSKSGRISAQLQSNSIGEGGAIQINASETINLQDANSAISTGSEGQGRAGDVTLQTSNLSLKNGALINLTTNQGQGGNLLINSSESINLEGINTRIGTDSQGINNAGEITVNTRNLTISNGAAISSAANNQGDTGIITINSSESVFIQGINTGISNETQGSGNGRNLTINTPKLTLSAGGSLFSTTSGQGQGGTINLQTEDLILQSGARLAVSTTETGNAGNILVNTTNLDIDGSMITASTGNRGEGGSILINANSLNLSNQGRITVITGGQGNAGNISLTSQDITLNNSQISAETQDGGEGGIIQIDTNSLTNNNSTITAQTSGNGEGGDILINATTLQLDNQGQITTLSQGEGNAGNININLTGLFQANNGLITANSSQASGGEINITAQDIRLSGNSDIRTNVESGVGGGGNITLTADSIINFNDSDILAFARDGKGGNITLNTPVFFGDGYQPISSVANPDTLDGNGRVDINASGAVFGVILIPDLTFIQNSFVQLPDSLINPETLISNRCITPNNSESGQFIIKGSGGLPNRPNTPHIPQYPTGDVQPLPNDNSAPTWQKGDPIIEPQGVYRSPEGRIFLSRDCS